MTGKWRYEVSKVKLAEALWPTHEQKIDQLKADTKCSGPAHRWVINDAYHVTQQWRYPSFVLTEAPDAPDEQQGE
jgi:hypothetical protein